MRNNPPPIEKKVVQDLVRGMKTKRGTCKRQAMDTYRGLHGQSKDTRLGLRKSLGTARNHVVFKTEEQKEK